MSRSCHSGMPSMTGTTCARTTRASPAIRSDRIGFFLCGIADEPFWPEPNGSDSSRTSVRWPCRTSSATASQTVAMIASARHPLADPVAQHHLGRRRRPARSPSSADDRRPRSPGRCWSTCRPAPESLPTADRLAGPRAAGRGSGAIANAKSATRCPQTSGSAWMPCVRPTRSVPRCASAWSRSAATSAVGLGQQQVGGLGRAAAPARCRAGRTRSCRSARRRRPRAASVLSAQAVRNAITSCCGDRLDLGDRLGGRRRRGAHRLDAVGRDRAGGGVRLEHQRLDPAPQLVLVRLAPDPAHLGQRVALDHPVYPAAAAAGTRSSGGQSR